MTTLHIEHAISSLEHWQAAFGRFAEHRQKSGVRDARVMQPVADPRFIVIHLDFDSAEQATEFLEFLEQEVWTSTERSPALVGKPRTMILEPVSTQG